MPRLKAQQCLMLALCGLLVSLACAQTAPAPSGPENPERRSFRMRLFSRPAKPTPLTQMAYGLILEAQGRARPAIQAYADLTRIWPRSKQAPQAQFRRAQLLLARGDLMDAFNAYTELLELYSAHYPYEQVLENQFLIARRILEMRHARWFFGIGFRDPERAVPLLKSIVARGPRLPQAAEAQYLIGEAYRRAGEPELAMEAYGVCHSRYPESPFAQRALSARAKILRELARRSPHDLGLNQAATVALTFFLRQYPENPAAPEIRTALADLLNTQAKAAYRRARFYDARRYDPSAAIAAYQRFIEAFPASEWTAAAQARLAELQPRKDKPDENP